MIKLFTKKFLFSSILFLLFHSVTASVPDSLSYHLLHFTSENGLPQNSVKAIASDKNGFIWLTTEGGLVRFDGAKFLVFNKGNTAISSNRMRYLLRGMRSGDLYAMAEDDQMIRIQEGRVRPLPLYNKVFVRFPLGGGDSLYAYRSIGLPNLFWPDLRLKGYQIPLSSASYFLLSRDTVRLYDKKKEIWQIPYKNSGFQGFFTINKSLYHLNGRGIFTAIRQDSLKKMRLEGDILKDPVYLKNALPQLYWNILSGDVFVYLNKRFYLLEQAGNSLTTRLLLWDFDFPLNNIYSAHYNHRHQRLFLGSYTRGLFVFNRKRFQALRAGDINGGDENYYAQVPFEDNTVLTSKGNRLGVNGSLGKLPQMENYSDGYSLLIGEGGTIWTKDGQSVYMLSPEGQHLLRRIKLPALVTQICGGLNGEIWAGTETAGLFRINENKAELVFPGMPGITYLLQNSPDVLWAGTKAGLYKFTIPESKAELIAGTEQAAIRSIYSPQSGELWFTSLENGFFLYKEGKLSAFPLDRDAYLASPHYIMEDKNGFFWIPTNKGLFQAAKRDLLNYAAQKQEDILYIYYGKEAGFNTNEFNGGCEPCGVKLENGYFSLPSLNGLVWFKPELIRAELPFHKLYIDEIEVDSMVSAGKDTLNLDSRFNRLQVFLSTPYFGNPYNLRIKYRLDGPSGPGNWLRVNKDNIISFSALPSGTYRLVIRKQDGFGDANFSEKALVIIIPPMFYETWWFILALIIAALLAIYLYIRFRLKNIKRKNDELEKRIGERTLKLRQTILAQQASEENLRRQNYLQQRLFAAITHDIKSPLQYLTMAARNLHESLEAREDAAAEGMQQIYSSSSRIYNCTENLVQYIKVNMADNRFDYATIKLYDLINAKIAIFAEIALSRGNTIANLVEPCISVRTNEQLLGIIIHNLLDNAVKFTREGTIRFSSVRTDGHLQIHVEDTGRGMTNEMLSWCNSCSSRQHPLPPNSSHGLGLTIVSELLAMIDGKMHVRSKAGQGTCTVLTINL